MLQLINSSSIRDSVIKKFELGKHWGLNPQKEYYLSTMHYLYGKRVSVKKTEFESVMIDVMDADPETACDIVSAIIGYYDQSVSRLQKKKFHEVVVNYQGIINRKKQVLDSIQLAIDLLTKAKGLPAVVIPDPALQRSFADKIDDKQEELKEKRKKKLSEIELNILDKMRAFPGTKDAQLVLLTSLAMSEAEAYSELCLKYDEALLNYNRDYTYSNIVTTPFVSDKKAFPKPWIIVSLSALAALFLSLVTISFIENKRHSIPEASNKV
ncbi:MAG: hypothetical protein AB9842_01315 [Bacteroidales bacterium]